MSNIARPSQIKVTDEQLKDLIIKYSINPKDGSKVSNRDIIANKDFQNDTGLKSRYGEGSVSIGTYSYHVNRLKISDSVIYEIGRKRCLIPSGVPFDEWSNKRSERKKTLCANENSTLSEIDIWSKVKDYVGLTAISLDAVSIEDLKSTLNLIGYSDNKIEELYNKFK